MKSLDLINVLNGKVQKLQKEFEADGYKIGHTGLFWKHCHRRLTYVWFHKKVQSEKCNCCKKEKIIQYAAMCKNPECEYYQTKVEIVSAFLLSIISSGVSVAVFALTRYEFLIITTFLSFLFFVVTLQLIMNDDSSAPR